MTAAWTEPQLSGPEEIARDTYTDPRLDQAPEPAS
jgi:hypothetical protein